MWRIVTLIVIFWGLYLNYEELKQPNYTVPRIATDSLYLNYEELKLYRHHIVGLYLMSPKERYLISLVKNAANLLLSP